MNINQRINFRSWRWGAGPKLFKDDIHPDDGAFAFWNGIYTDMPCHWSDIRNINARAEREFRTKNRIK